ncbi:OmpW family protein [Massilia sp. CF038]|uniref:OmpW/AlkL family protein n=1 Tax=Massilia sp. CF038 TaxID=1881045 RepID=UPI0009167386|nr:OmpW family outer membrane protein [Massilia sp. CF038]SHG34603.1 outer membrane protein [Massilia sp. CF038]
MKRTTLSLLSATLATVFSAAAPVASAQDSPWLVRARAVHLSPADKSAPIGGVGAADRLTVESRTIPEFDISYFFSPNLAAELVLTVPQKHDVMLDGARIGSFRHLPPTLLAQYRFDPVGQFTPYLGAGLNYTRISSVHLLDGAADLDNHSVGLALQAGVDVAIDRHWSINVDIKRVNIRSDVRLGGMVVSEVKVDPTLIAVGLGYRF